MARKQPYKESIPPTLPPQRAIELLKEKLSQIDQIQQMSYYDPAINKWALTTMNILDGTFGKPDGEMHDNTYHFVHASGGSLRVNMSPQELQRHHQTQTRNRKAVLESIIEQLEILAPSATQPD